MSQAREPALAAVIQDATGTRVAACDQCGKCTAGCPMAKYMDLAASRIMRLAQIGSPSAVERLLRCGAIWSCAGCLTCTQRCPRQCDPAGVMDVLREMSLARGKASAEQRKVLAFHKAFLKTVEQRGRMSEALLVARYKLLSLDLLTDLGLAPAMLARGKLRLPSKVIRGRDEVRRIFAACRQGGTR